MTFPFGKIAVSALIADVMAFVVEVFAGITDCVEISQHRVGVQLLALEKAWNILRRKEIYED